MTKTEMLSARNLFIRNQHCRWDEYDANYDAQMYAVSQQAEGFSYDDDVDFGTCDLINAGA